jgi:protein O-mannosyl-transferase
MFTSVAAALRDKILMTLGSALLVLLLVTAYADHFQNSFHFDDAHTIKTNAAIRELRNIPQFFRDATTSSSLPSNQSYRPRNTYTAEIA